VLPENLDDVFHDFKLGWIDAKTFSEPLGEKNQTSFDRQHQSVYIDLLEGRYYKESTYTATEQPV
jgi:hypothetical protein